MPPAVPAIRSRRYVSVALKVSATTALLVMSALVLANLMASSGRPVAEWMAVYALAILSIALLFTLFLDRVLTTPVRRLAAHATRMARGDYATALTHPSQDEIGELFAAIEYLRASFLGQKEALEELNRSLDAKVDARTSELSRAMTELKAAQEALVKSERLASIGGLAGGVAHEINNPTGVILTRAGFLLRIAKEEGLSEDVVEDLTAIHRQAERIARITSSLLSFSRQTPGEKESIALKDIVSESVNLIESNLRGTDVKLVVEVPDELPRIHGDKGRLEQVMVNLLKNAVDAMSANGADRPPVLSLRASASGDGLVRVKISDTGPGIPEEARSKIFEPFYTTKEVGKGTGLGLSIAYGIIAEHGGELTVESAPGEGTQFTLVLPTHPSEAEDDPLVAAAGAEGLKS